MVYEARHARRFNIMMGVAVLLLSILGFAAAGVIGTKSGSNPAVGWAIVAACFAAAFVFFRRSRDDRPQARIDERGVWARRNGPDPVPWSEIHRFHVIRSGIQAIARFGRDGGRDFGINVSFYDRGIGDLVAAVRHHRPDLVS